LPSGTPHERQNASDRLQDLTAKTNTGKEGERTATENRQPARSLKPIRQRQLSGQYCSCTDGSINGPILAHQMPLAGTVHHITVILNPIREWKMSGDYCFCKIHRNQLGSQAYFSVTSTDPHRITASAPTLGSMYNKISSSRSTLSENLSIWDLLR
jgi:hypothetical protein